MQPKVPAKSGRFATRHTQFGEIVEEQVTFEAGDITLEGLLCLPPEPATTGVVLCHPHPLYGGDMGNKVVSALAAGFQRAGLATLRFNFRGVGQSGGTHGNGEAELADVDGAVAYLASRSPVSKLTIVGYSFGAMVGLQFGAADPRVHALIGLGTPVERIDAAALSSAGKPILLVSGDADHISSAEGLKSLAERLPEPKQLVLLPGVDHFFAGHEEEAARTAITFVESL